MISSNQYLRPEYLTPLPATLDAKKCPLALLAQTCSQIGADSSNNKLFQATDKKKSESSKDKPEKTKPYDINVGREKSRTPDGRTSSGSNRVRTPVASKSTRCPSNQSASSPRSSPDRKTPAETVEESRERSTPQSPASSSSTPTKTTITDSTKDMPLGTFKPTTLPPTSAYLGAYAPPGIPMGLDLMTSSLMSQHHALKSAGLSPYMNYARMKSASEMIPLCRDPYCTGCGLSSHLMPTQKPPCPPGCTHCDHPTSKANSYMSHNQAAAAYAHAQLAALAAASHLPYVCNWISSESSYCGKRFSSSDELLSHLRTHTSVSVSEASALSMLSASGIPPTHPLLQRTYPTPPLSPLATARYHPYSKPSLLPPSLSSPLGSFQLGHPGLSPYLSPYSLYGPRLGAAPSMHP